MKGLLIALACLTLALPSLAQNADDPATKDDVILYLRTMHSHDLMQKSVAVQFESMRQLIREQIAKDKGMVPADFDTRFKKIMDDMAKNMPFDDIIQAMIPAYEKHFTHGDIEAMNAFYSSPVGQKVLEELPAVMQEGMQAAMPVLSKYITDSQERMKHEFDTGDGKQPKIVPVTPIQK